MLIVGLGFSVQMASSNTLLQTIVDDDKRGRHDEPFCYGFLWEQLHSAVILPALWQA